MAEKKQSTEEKENKKEDKIKTCFVIMPISDSEGYESGHFKRVYDHIIKPACVNAGFSPIRADDINTSNHIIIDMLKQIIEADMAICDLSGRNPNVLYELGIRQAFNLPVSLIKDEKTSRIFDIQTIRSVQYDSSLRIDKIEEAVPEITSAMLNTYNDKIENVNSIVQLLGIKPAEVTKTEVSNDTTLILNAINGINKRLYNLEDKNRTLSRSLNSISNIDNIYGFAFALPLHDKKGINVVKSEIKQIVGHFVSVETITPIYSDKNIIRLDVLFTRFIDSNTLEKIQDSLVEYYGDAYTSSNIIYTVK